jgi:hypothetical protein
VEVEVLSRLPRKNYFSRILSPICWNKGHNWYKQKVLKPHPSDSFENYCCLRCGKEIGENQYALITKGELFKNGPKAKGPEILEEEIQGEEAV